MFQLLTAAVGAIGLGATYVGANKQWSKKDAMKYLLCTFIVVISLYMYMLGQQPYRLSMKMTYIGCGVLTALFAIFYHQLKTSTENTTQFVKVVSIISAVMSGLVVLMVLAVVYAQNYSGLTLDHSIDDLIDYGNNLQAAQLQQANY